MLPASGFTYQFGVKAPGSFRVLEGQSVDEERQQTRAQLQWVTGYALKV